MAESSGHTTVQVNNLSEHIEELRELKSFLGDGSVRLRGIYKEIAESAAAKSQERARSMGGIQKRAAPAIKGAAVRGGASVRISPTKRTAMANVAFWGAKARTGWFADPLKYRAYPSAHPEWVGSSWKAATKGQGPYAINETLADEHDEILEAFESAVMDAVKGMSTITEF